MTDQLSMTDVVRRHDDEPCEDLYRDVLAFHERFDLPRPARPTLLDDEQYAFRRDFLREELREFEAAHERGDLAGAFDGLLDLVYVALGTAIFMGLPWDAGWYQVQRANMAKVPVERPEDSKRGSRFDIVKPAGWHPPEIAHVLGHWDSYVTQLERQQEVDV